MWCDASAPVRLNTIESVRVRRFLFESKLGSVPELDKHMLSFRAMCTCLDLRRQWGVMIST